MQIKLMLVRYETEKIVMSTWRNCFYCCVHSLEYCSFVAECVC